MLVINMLRGALCGLLLSSTSLVWGEEGPKSVDLDQDGVDEIVSATSEGTISCEPNGTLLRGNTSPARERVAPDPPQPQPGWPIVTEGAIRSSAAFADLDHDGNDEVIVGSSDERMYVFSAWGDTLPGWPQTVAGEIYSSPAVADIDGDGELEIIVGSWWGMVYAWERDGTPVAGQWPRSVFGRVAASPSVGDIDGDGHLEIVIASYYANQGVIYGFEFDGSDASGWPLSLPTSILATPALADIDEDGRLEVIIGTGSSQQVYALNGEDASTVAGWPVSTTGWVVSSAAIGDIDRDGHLEVVVGDSNWGGHAWVFEADGETAINWPIDVENNVVGSPSLADLDGDGDLEIVIPSSIYYGSPYTSKLWICHHDATKFGNWPVSFPAPDERAEGNPAIIDMDGDGTVELVLGTGNGSASCANWYAFNLDTTLLDGYPMYGEDIYASAATGDIDDDGRLEVAVGSWNDCAIHCWEQSEGSFHPDLMPWPKFSHDQWNTGLYGFRVPSAIESAEPPVEIPGRLVRASPNPSSGTTTFEYALTLGEWVNLSIHDSQGRLVRLLMNGDQTAGKHLATWDGRQAGGRALPAGVYYYQLNLRETTSRGRLTLLRE